MRYLAMPLLTMFLALSLLAQTAQPGGSQPVSYASVNQLNLLVSQLQQAVQASQGDLAKLRIEKWKTDGNTKKQALANVDSISRNLQTALPEIVSKLQSSPEDLSLTFKLYRNLDALYDVFGSVVESTGAFGSKEEFQMLDNDLGAMERARRSFADRMETLAGSKEVELTRLRNDLRSAQAAAASAPPKKVIVDDNEPAKKPVKKKTTAKKPAPATPPSDQAPKN